MFLFFLFVFLVASGGCHAWCRQHATSEVNGQPMDGDDERRDDARGKVPHIILSKGIDDHPYELEEGAEAGCTHEAEAQTLVV